MERELRDLIYGALLEPERRRNFVDKQGPSSETIFEAVQRRRTL